MWGLISDRDQLGNTLNLKLSPAGTKEPSASARPLYQEKGRKETKTSGFCFFTHKTQKKGKCVMFFSATSNQPTGFPQTTHAIFQENKLKSISFQTPPSPN